MQGSGKAWLRVESDHQVLAAHSLALGWLETPLLALHLVSLSFFQKDNICCLATQLLILGTKQVWVGVWLFSSLGTMHWVTVLRLVSWSPENRKGQKMHLSLYQGSPKAWKALEAAPASWGWKDTGLVFNKGDVTMALWAGAGDLGALDIQRSRLWLCFMVIKFFVPLGSHRSLGWEGQEWWPWWRGWWRR